MATSRPNPKSYDGPVAVGYPVEPTAEDIAKCKRVCCYCLICFVLILGGVISLIILDPDHKENPARFRLESVSVSVDNSTAVWDVGFSIDKPVGGLDVWIRFGSRNLKAESVGSAGNATVSITESGFGFDSPGGVITLEQVMFKRKKYTENSMQAACKDVAVGFSSNETKGVMIGGPRWCPEVWIN